MAANEVICGGILVADHVCTPMEALPDEGRLVAVEAMYLRSGGCAANVAVDVAKQGIGVSVAGRVGDDYWGRFIQEDLAAAGVDVGAIRRSEREQTSQTMILLCRGQDRRFVHTFGANREFSAGDVDRASLRGARVFYLGGYLVLPSLAPEALADLFRECRELGVRTVLDVVVPTGYRYGGELEPVLPYTDVFLPNDDEAATLTGEKEPEQQAAALRARGTETVVITLGGEGLLAAGPEGVWRAGHFPAEAVDATGAGDAFCAGYIAGMVRGQDMEGRLRYGSALGAACVGSMGACEGVLTAPEVAAFLERNRLEIERVG